MAVGNLSEREAVGMVQGGGRRVSWVDLPPVVRAEVEQRLGGSVRVVRSMPGGFTPGMACVLEGDGGRRVFVKAISAATTPEGPGIYRREAAISGALPSMAPVPRFLWWFQLADWVVLAFEHIDGRSPDLSRADDRESVLHLYTHLAASLDPAPLQAPTSAEACADDFGNWATFSRLRIPAGVSDLPAWLPAAVPRLAELEAGWEDVTKGTCLLHGDLRGDNMLITNTGEVVAVDWPEACVGAPWVDLVLALPSFTLLGVDPEGIVRCHPLTRQLHSKVIDTLLSAVAGHFTSRCSRHLLVYPRSVTSSANRQSPRSSGSARETTPSATLTPDRDGQSRRSFGPAGSPTRRACPWER